MNNHRRVGVMQIPGASGVETNIEEEMGKLSSSVMERIQRLRWQLDHLDKAIEERKPGQGIPIAAFEPAHANLEAVGCDISRINGLALARVTVPAETPAHIPHPATA